MQMLIATRGIKHEVERWADELSAQYFPFPIKDIPSAQMQIHVRPIQLFEIVFPREALPDVLATVRPQSFNEGLQNSWVLNLMRKIIPAGHAGLKYQPIPFELMKYGTAKPLYRPCMDIVGIGIKEDGDVLDKDGKVKHERI